MSKLIDPATNRPVDIDRLLALLKVWTTDPQVLHTLIVTEKRISTQQAITMAHRVKATMDGKPKAWVLSDLALAIFALQILDNRNVRRVIAKRTLEETRKERPEATAQEVLQNLADLKLELERDYRVAERERQWDEETKMQEAGLVHPGAAETRVGGPGPLAGAPRIIQG